MASSSSTIGTPQWKYDVFLSFRGKDTRDSFTAHLHDALCRSHIEAYIDTRLRGGEKIEPALLKIIEESYISVVIFSENYADSSFCLRELSKILECRVKKGQEVIPVFCGVDPSHVQGLTGSFGAAILEHMKKYSVEEVVSWGHALKEIANGKGWDSNVTKPEPLLITEIVDDILEKLEKLFPWRDPRGLVGLDSRANRVESLLRLESLDTVCTVGIAGMGGIGKTTIAEVVYNRISKKFDGGYFLRNVREELEECTLVHLRDRIVSKLLGKENLEIGTHSILPTHFSRMIGRKKFLLVLDDVSSSQQLKALVGEDGLFGLGSRIIVTSRDMQVLRKMKAEIYEVENLSPHESLQLFASCACQEKPCTGEYMKLSKLMAQYCGGHPFALKVLGSNLHGRSIEYWRYEKEKLQSSGPLDTEIHSCLRSSFEGLDETQKNIFLDIACCFGRFPKDRLQDLWELSEFHPTTGIPSLIDKGLINVSEDRIVMHDLLQKLGRDIVCEVEDPRKRSRLWILDDIIDVLKHPKGTETIESISIDTFRIEEMELSPTVFKKMYNLRLLRFYNPNDEEIKIHLPEGLELLPDKLVLLCWFQYPLTSLPLNFRAKNLVELLLPHSQLEKLWDGFPLLEHLKVMDLSDSRNLIRIDFSKVPNLKRVNLTGCISLDEIPSSIDQYCSKLEMLNLEKCKNLGSFPSCLNLTSLEYLSLCGCQKIKEFPKLHSSIKLLDLRKTGIETVPSSVGDLSQLFWLRMDDCKSLETVASSIVQLECLETLDFPGCSNLSNLPNSICDLKSLENLDLSSCRKMDRLPENLRNLKSLRALEASELLCRSREGLRLLPFTEDWGHLTILSLCDCGISEIPSSLGLLVSLISLNLSCNKFESIPPSINQLSELTHLFLFGCESLRCLPELPSSLKILLVNFCSSLESVTSIVSQVQTEYRADSELFNFGNCFKLKQNGIDIKIMEEAGQRIQRLAASLCNQGYEVDHEHGDPIRAGFCIPGSEVPKWFSHQNTQGSLIIEVKPRCDGSWFLGCAFCVVLASPLVSPEYSVEEITCECRLITESGGHETVYCTWNNVGEYLSDHIFVWYDSNLSYNHCFSKASFQFHTTSDPEFAQLKGNVIKCGVAPLFV